MTNEELIEALEAATGPSRWLDAQIAVASRWKPLGNIKHWIHEWPAGMSTGEWEGWVYLVDAPVPGTKWEAPAFTSSLDAALTLVPEGWRWSLGLVCEWPDTRWVSWCKKGLLNDVSGFAPTPALALCIAALKARSAQP